MEIEKENIYNMYTHINSKIYNNKILLKISDSCKLKFMLYI